MKGFRKGFLLTLLTLLCLSMGMFVACKGKNKVTISFELNGAETQSFEPMEVIAGEDMVLRIPTREGYEFTGWYDNAELKGTALMGGTVTAPQTDTTYYASWAQLFKVTLDCGEGAFADGDKTKEIYVAKGKKLLDALSEYAPTYNSLQFGAWFGANDQITEDSVMPGREVRFTAKYSVGYSVEIYKQESASVYVHDGSLDSEALGFYGDNLSVDTPTLEGYEFFRNHPEGVPTLKLGENASSNVFKLYYNKLAHTIIYDVNAPENATYTGYMADQKILHGEEGRALECTYAIHSYRFAGWARSASADVEFHPGDVLPEGSYTLYAVWDAGYSDVFGGTDCIFIPHTGRDGTAILLRGNAEIIGRTNNYVDGKYVEDVNGMFVVFNENLIAKLVDSEPKGFSFLDEDMAGEYKFYNPYYVTPEPAVVAADTVLTLDGFDGAVLKNSENLIEYSFSLDEESGNYKLTGDRGTFYAVLGKEGDQKVFTFVGSEKGTYDQFIRVNVTGYAPGDYTLSLDGLGNASWIMGVTGAGIRGRYEEPETINGYQFVTVHLDDDRELKFSFLEFETTTAVELNDGMAGTYTLSTDESVELVLDGFGGYTGKTTFKGDAVYYMLEDTIFGKIVNIMPNMTTVSERYKLDEDGKHFSTFTDNYTVYQYLYSPDGLINQVGNFYLVIYDEENGEQKASVIKSVNGTNTKVYDGTVTLDEELRPLSVFKAEEGAKLDTEFPYKEFKFYGSDRFAAGPLFYIYLDEVPNATEEGGTYITMKVRDTNQKLIVYTGLNTTAGYGLEGLGSFLVDADGRYVEGSVDTILLDAASMNNSKNFFGVDNYYSFTYYNDQNTLSKRFFEVYQIGDEAATATYEVAEVNDEPMALAICYGEMPQGTEYPFAMEMSLYLNGKGEARYLTETAEGSVFVKGTYVSMGLVNEMRAFRITFDDPNVPSMNGQDVEIAISALDPIYYHVHNKIMEGTNVIEGNSYVELNGWGTYAHYVDNFGHSYEGYYTFYAGQTGILMYSDMRTGVTQVYIRDGKFINTPPEVSGAQQGWRVVDQNFEEYLDPNTTAIFDGEGGVTIEDMYAYMNWLINGGDSNIYGLKRNIYGRGFYTAVSEFEYDIEVGFYDEDGNVKNTEKWRAKLVDGCCVRMGEGAVGSYIQESDKAVLYLDGYGTGFYVDGRGNREDGNYLFVDEANGIGMFLGESASYMVNYSGEGANRSFRILNDPKRFKTFYADDLSSIEFCDTLKVDGQSIGLWYFDDSNTFVFYEFTENGFEKTDTYHYEETDTYHDQAYDRDKTYKAWNESKELELKGEIVFRAINERKDQKNGTIENATLNFTPNGITSIDAPAVLKYKDFRGEATEKAYKGIYTVKMVEKETIVGAGEAVNATYHLFLCYGDMEFPLTVSLEKNSFKLWANIDLDGKGNDVNVLTGSSTTPFAEVNFGRGYTLGVMNWALSDWDIKNDTLIGGYAKAVDKNGDLIFFEILWSDYKGHDEKCIGATEEAIGNLNIFEIFTENLKGDGVTVVLLETYELSNMAAFYYVLYAACEWYEVPKVYLPKGNLESELTDDYRVYQERVISTSKGFSVGGVAYQHVYKRIGHGDEATEADDGQAPEGFESISTGFIAYMMNVDMILVDSLGDIKAGNRVLALTPEHISKDVWDYDQMTLWFGVDKRIEAKNTEKGNESNFIGVSYDILFLTNEYKNKDNTGKEDDNRKVLDGWLVYYYIEDPTTNKDIAYSYRYGYEDNGKARISRITCKDEVTMYDLHFSGTIYNPTVSYEQYIPPKEDDDKDKDDGTDQSEGEGKEEDKESSGS